LLDAAVLRVAGCACEPTTVPPLPPIAATIAGRTFDMAVPSGSLAVTLRFPSEAEARLAVTATQEVMEGTPLEWAAGLDGVPRFGPGQHGVLASGTGTWTRADTFVMSIDTVGLLDRIRLTLVFSGRELTLTLEDLDTWRPDPPMVLTGQMRR
jgi:hypothetical protein